MGDNIRRGTSILSNEGIETYSFSKLSRFQTCPYSYKLRYVDDNQGIDNVFSAYGTLVHSILERYSKGELEIWELANVFDWEFDCNIIDNFPYDKEGKIRDNYKKQGLNFFSNFEGYDDVEILGVEQEFFQVIEDWQLHGFIDLLYRNQDGKIIIRDYKSKSSLTKKEQEEYSIQLYLYSLWVKEQYGEYPDLELCLFRTNKVIKIQYDEQALLKAKDWAINLVNAIRETFNYPPVCNQYYCNNICNYREICDLKDE